jgi:Transposase DDE domain
VPDKITHVADAMQRVLDLVPEAVARSTGFIKRERKLDAPTFVKALVFGWLADPGAGLGALANVAALLGCPIKPQSLEDRFPPAAADLLLRVLEASLAAVVAADPVPIPVLGRFTEVVVMDSSTVSLPESLRAGYAGCGTSNPQAGNAAVKLTVAWDLKGGRLRGPLLDAGRVNDKKAAEAMEAPPAGSLRVADLGYFQLDQMAAMARDGVYFLSRFLPLTTVYDERGARWPRLSELLERHGDRAELPIRLGERARLPCRLVAARVSPAVAEHRRAKLRREAQSQRRRISPEVLALAAWTTYVTNAPPHKLGPDEAREVGRARWQIELLFKLWKGEGRIDESRSGKPMRVLCELYAKLIAMIIQHWVVLVSGWEHADRSAVKMARTIRERAWGLAEAVGRRAKVREIVMGLRRIFANGCRVDRRRKHPATCHRLLNLGCEGLT